MNNIIENKIVKQIANSVGIILVRYFKLAVIVLVVTILVLGFFFLIKPKYKSIISEKEKIGVPEDLIKYEERVKYLHELEKISAGFKEVKAEDIKRIKALAPIRSYHEELLAQLEKIVLENGLLLNSVTIAEAGSDTASNANPPKGGEKTADQESGLPVKKIKISISITGTDYIGLKNLLNIFENNLRLMDIVSLSADTENKTTSLEAYAYYLE